MALQNTTQVVARSIYEVIRNLLVREGYWPDEGSPNYPDTPTGLANWQAALQNIHTTRGFIIEPFGVSTAEPKGAKKVPRIVILQKRNLPGNIGNPPNPEMAPDPNSNGRVWAIAPPLSKFIHFEVHLIANTAEQIWILEAILEEAFAARAFVPYYNQPDETFFIRQQSFYDIPDPIEGVSQKVYSYEVTDMYLSPSRIIQSAVVPIKEITVETYLGSDTSATKDTPDMIEGTIVP